jgi:hypothetical protein
MRTSADEIFFSRVTAHAPHARLLLTHTPALLAAPENIAEGDTVEVNVQLERL